MKDDTVNNDDPVDGANTSKSLKPKQENYWHEKPRIASQQQIQAHIAIMVTKSAHF